jgi:hypothetical protein
MHLTIVLLIVLAAIHIYAPAVFHIPQLPQPQLPQLYFIFLAYTQPTLICMPCNVSASRYRKPHLQLITAPEEDSS